MTSISIEALKGKTIKQIRELIKQAERLPDNHNPQEKKDVNSSYGKHLEPRSTDRGRQNSRTMPVGCGNQPVDTKTQTAQELLQEINNE